MRTLVKKITVIKQDNLPVGKPSHMGKEQHARKCGNKKQFFSELSCNGAMQRFIKRQKEWYDDERPIVMYKCSFCGWWHFGHAIGTEKELTVENDEQTK